jgi:hypothetical protein
MAKGKSEGTLPTHGARMLPSVEVDSYNFEVEDDEGFIGDKASKSAFRAILDDVRAVLRQGGDDPLGDQTSEEISKKKLDNMLSKGDAEAAAVVQTAASSVRPFPAGRVEEMAIARTGILLKEADIDVAIEASAYTSGLCAKSAELETAFGVCPTAQCE